MQILLSTNVMVTCSYQNPEGQMRLRVTTITRAWVDGSNTEVSYGIYIYICWSLHQLIIMGKIL